MLVFAVVFDLLPILFAWSITGKAVFTAFFLCVTQLLRLLQQMPLLCDAVTPEGATGAG